MDSPSLKYQLAALGFLAGAIVLLSEYAPVPPVTPQATPSTQSAIAASARATSSVATSSSSATPKPTVATSTVAQKPVPTQASTPTPTTPKNPNEIRRIENPYPTPPLTFETVNTVTRLALVNIFCTSNSGLLRPVSGSAIFIDSKGIILTNAHVAQYVLLADSGRVNLHCQVRTGSPAVARWTPHVLYLPPVWIEEHAKDLTTDRPTGTGKHDYALLYAGNAVDGSPRTGYFPAILPDTRDAIGFESDAVLSASYPAEFLGSIASSFNLYPVTSTTRIADLFTLGTGTVDVISIGNVIGAQSGSSGGAVVNAWSRLIGLITTTSEGSTTGERDLRGITLSYIDRDIEAQSGKDLAAFLAGDPATQGAAFSTLVAPALVDTLLKQLSQN